MRTDYLTAYARSQIEPQRFVPTKYSSRAVKLLRRILDDSATKIDVQSFLNEIDKQPWLKEHFNDANSNTDRGQTNP